MISPRFFSDGPMTRVKLTANPKKRKRSPRKPTRTAVRSPAHHACERRNRIRLLIFVARQEHPQDAANESDHEACHKGSDETLEPALCDLESPLQGGCRHQDRRIDHQRE